MTTMETALPAWQMLLFANIVDEILKAMYLKEYLPFGLGEAIDNYISIIPTRAETLDPFPTYAEFLLAKKEQNSFSNLYEFAFKTPSTSLGELTSKDGIVVVIGLVLLLRQLKAILLPMFCDFGRKIGRSTHGEEWERHNEERITKFGEYVFRFGYHLVLSIFGIWYFSGMNWWDKSQGGTKNLWYGYPNNQPVDVGMAWYYLLQSAYNVEALISLAELSCICKIQSPITPKTGEWRRPLVIGWSPTIRGDFREMAIHHAITNLLVVGSSFGRFTRIGSMVFLVHDISDVPVDMSKLANFMKWKKTTTCAFVTMVLCWVICRLGILPFTIFKSILTESQILVESEGLNPVIYHVYFNVFVFLVGAIICLHIFWFFILVRIGFHLVTKGEQHDLSEHKTGEDQGITAAQSKKES